MNNKFYSISYYLQPHEKIGGTEYDEILLDQRGNLNWVLTKRKTKPIFPLCPVKNEIEPIRQTVPIMQYWNLNKKVDRI